MPRALTEKEIKDRFKDRPFEILDIFKKEVGLKKSLDTYLKLKCNIDGNIWDSRLNDLSKGCGCLVCSHKKLAKYRSTPRGNSFRDVRPDLINFLKDEDDADRFTILTRKKTWFICDSCKHEKFMSVGNFVRDGIRCPICSDGISTPEKFCINLLKELNVEFITQYSDVWSNSRKYDFYLPNMNIIIETHGIQHYENINFGTRSLEEEIENDIYKEKLAIENGISNYIKIDCRYSTLDWLENNFKNELYTFFNLDNINFNEIFSKSIKSIKYKVWEFCNNNLDCKIEDVCDEFKINRTTVVVYIAQGVELGLCNYDYKNRKKINLENRISNQQKAVNKYDLNYNFIESYKSIKQAEIDTGILATGITRACRNIQKTCGGFIWTYAEEII